MSYEKEPFSPPAQVQEVRRRSNYLLHLVLFLLTFLTTTLAGAQWVGKDPFELRNFASGLPYSIAILFVLSCHEFGHYFAAKYHGVKTTLPYYIPFPPVLQLFGTLGAVIRVRSLVPNRKAMFDIGVAGPIAGFVACIAVLIYGFQTLPGPEYIFSIHPEYGSQTGAITGSAGMSLEFGQTLMFKFMTDLLTDPTTQFVPPMSEIYHYPLLCVGWFGFFVTAMNLIPIGQFDGGHIAYTMFGARHRNIALAAFFFLVALGLPSVLDLIVRSITAFVTGEPTSQIVPFAEQSWWVWLLWALISYRLVGLVHPPVPDESPLDERRMAVGWFCFAIFVVCFSFTPFTI